MTASDPNPPVDLPHALEGLFLKKQLFTLVIGFVAGISVTLAFKQFNEGSDRWEPPVVVTPRSTEEAHEYSDPSGDGEQSSSVPSPENSIGDSETEVQADVPEIRMPSNYREMIGPVRPRQPSFAEQHADFASEPRDESWAVAMETGINDYVASSGATLGLVVEYVECRSRTCEIAGFQPDRNKGNVGSLYTLPRQPWWQGGSANSAKLLTQPGDAGKEYFVIIYHDGPR